MPLKRAKNLTGKHLLKLAELLQYNPKSIISYLLKDDLQQLWTYTYPDWASRLLHAWYTKTTRSEMDPIT